MANLQKCPRCQNTKSWAVRRGKRRCSVCRYEWRANRLPLHLSRSDWKRLLRWFFLGQSSTRVAQEAHLGRGTAKQAAFGILCRNGQVWAEIVPNVEASTLLPLLRKRVAAGAIVCSDTFRSYTGVAAKGYVHRLVRHEQQEYRDGQGSHINGLEGFWGYLKRMLAAKGGIREERLPLYLAEYVWRYNHRGLEIKDQIKCILALLENKYKLG